MGKIKTRVEFTTAAIDEAVASMRPHPLEVRCIDYLNMFTNPTERARVGLLLFGKRYGRDIAPRCDLFPD